MMKLLLISNSTNYGEEYLQWPKSFISDFLNTFNVKKVLFVPYAGISLSPLGLNESYNAYEKKVKEVFISMGFEIYSIHHQTHPIKAVMEAEAIAVGGGNTFHLVYCMQKLGIMSAIRERALDGIPYLGWSAGSNVACPSLMTTNDMPIIQPPDFECMNLVPFQINPHYLDKNPEGHGGETREARIEEFLILHPQMPVVGLREASLLEVIEKKMVLKGSRAMRLFQFGHSPREFAPGSDISHLLKPIN